MESVAAITGHRLCAGRMTTPTWVSRRRPSAPPGVGAGEILCGRPRASSSATASVAERERAVVLAVGEIQRTGFFRHAGVEVGVRLARERAASPAVRSWRSAGAWRLTSGTMVSSSSLEPEFDSAITTSSG